MPATKSSAAPASYRAHVAKVLAAMPTGDPALNMRVAARQWQDAKGAGAKSARTKPTAKKVVRVQVSVQM
jgi:hypothetical protein